LSAMTVDNKEGRQFSNGTFRDLGASCNLSELEMKKRKKKYKHGVFHYIRHLESKFTGRGAQKRVLACRSAEKGRKKRKE